VIRYIFFVAMFAGAVPARAQVARDAMVRLEFSSVYEGHFREVAKNYRCPTEEKIIPALRHFRALWEKEGSKVLARIREVTKLDFPSEDTPVYLVSCGRGFSSPLTVSMFYRKGKKIKSDGDFLYDLTHELLHHAAEHPSYTRLQQVIGKKYSGEPSEVFNHVLVAGFESRFWGHWSIENYFYKMKHYERALEIAREMNLIAQVPE
jgi:hypothetical protein